MKKSSIFLINLLFLLPLGLIAQPGAETLRGKVTDSNDGSPLAGVKVYWMGTEKGALSDDQGTFRIARSESSETLILSYYGFVDDTLDAAGLDYVEVRMKANISLDTVDITAKQNTTEISMLDPRKTETIGERELLKAACCNLAESFETSPSVDVSFTDAVTGTRQIQMLGLAGPYVQIMRENMPDVRGLSAIQGMGFVPGTWVESIQLNKGTGSVTNGYEGFAGQINVCLRQPEDMDRFFLNVYTNQMGRAEVNTHLRGKFSDRLSTALLLHGRLMAFQNDHNHDGFLDNPLDRRFIALNRWKFIGANGLRFQFGGKVTLADDDAGQYEVDSTDHVHQQHQSSGPLWTMTQRIRRGEGWAKIGRVYDDQPWKSVGLQLSAMHHDQQSRFGSRVYNARQSTFYGNLIYQSILGNTNHKFKTGASILYDDYREKLDLSIFDRTEIVPGAYFEYTYSQTEKLDVVAGIRADYHNLFGLFITPRLHARYAIAENTVFRISAGRGQRTASIVAENMGLLASNRAFVIRSEDSKLPYGLDAEVAWNYGANLTQKFTLDYREGTFTVDFFRTDFQNQIVIDLDQSPQQVVFYNLDGRSFSNSFQAQLDYELLKRLDVRLAYRWYDVKTTFDGVLRTKPLLAAHRAFVNVAYATRNHWRFDATLNWQGEKRLPITTANPLQYRVRRDSPSFFLLNGQVSKTWRERFELYLGGENILNFRQLNPILAADDPFGPYFDSSMIWGPVFGRNVYAGLRFKIK